MDGPGGQRRSKHMRLGTRSCAECRRRKVRCVFSGRSQTCQGCAAHDTPCTAQRPRSHREHDGASAETTAAQQQLRIQELENLVGRLCRAIDPDGAGSSNSMDPQVRAADSIKAYQQRQSNMGISDGSSNGDSADVSHRSGSLPSHHTTASSASIGPSSHPVDAPLIRLLQDALLIRESDGRLDDGIEDIEESRRAPDLLGTARPPLPDIGTVYLILQDTKAFWSLWPPYYCGPGLHDTLYETPVNAAAEHINNALGLGRGPTFCKALLWLALCIHQLPREWKHPMVNDSISRLSLINFYSKFAGMQLSMEGKPSLECIHGLFMQYTLLLDMGRPQRAWMSIRQAVAACTTMGMHRLKDEASVVLKRTWAQVWQVERLSSSMLGFPSAVTGPLVFLETGGGQSEALLEQIHHRVGIALGKVTARNQDAQKTTYATTIQLDEEAQDIRQLLPPEWWHPYTPSSRFNVIYSQEKTKFIYFLLVKLIHMPYMLKSLTDRRYEHSRLSVMEASREMIRSYHRGRQTPHGELAMCEVMDFQAFSSGVALLIGVLCSPAASSHDDDDRTLVQDLATSLHRTSLRLDCRVAGQGAKVIDSLLAIGAATDREQTDFTVTVPYFGELRITPVDTAAASAPDMGSAVVINVAQSSPKVSDLANSIEFRGDEFLYAPPDGFDFEMDLVQDWGCLLEDGARNNLCYGPVV